MKVSISIGRGIGLLRTSLLLMALLTGRVSLGQSKADSSLLTARPAVRKFAPAPDDRAPVRVRYPAPDALRDLQTDRDYRYDRDAPPPENPLAKIWAWILQKIGQFLRSEAYANVWQYVLLAAIAGLVVYLLRKAEVLGMLFSKNAQTSALNYETLTEDIHAINFDAAIDEAVSQRNYRLAVRLLYLQTLKRLTDADLIDYKPDKTNRQYVYELANSPRQAGFEGLTRQFEFVWYGDFPVDEARFSVIRGQFNAFSRTQQTAHG